MIKKAPLTLGDQKCRDFLRDDPGAEEPSPANGQSAAPAALDGGGRSLRIRHADAKRSYLLETPDCPDRP
jgi:hypothetical protein